ncbi:MAG: glycosyltransferase family 39 protein [Planctomycetales bacterium]|nr:glycosyltransferase family 39 protein [Planctomycetales bacterium]
MSRVRSFTTGTLGVLLLATLIRSGWLAADWASLTADPDAYWQLGENLAQCGTLGFRRQGESEIRPTAYRPPLYPLLIAMATRLGENRSLLAALHLALGVAACLWIYGAARRWLSTGWAALAALMVAVDPLLLRHSSLVMTETLAAALVAAVLYVESVVQEPASWRKPLVQGLLIGLLALCRPVFLLFAIVYAATPRTLESSTGNAWRRMLVFAVAFVLVLTPWLARNRWHWQVWIPGTTHGGYTLWLANNPSFYAYLDEGDWGEIWLPEKSVARLHISERRKAADIQFLHQRDRLLQLAEHDEPLADRQAYDLAWQAIQSHPDQILYACLTRVGRFWQLAPHRTAATESNSATAMRYGIGVGYGILFALASIGIFASRRQSPAFPWHVVLSLLASMMLVHAFYWTNMRMRAPLEPAVALLAALGLERVWATIRQ